MTLKLGPRINFFWGDNGAGKTSVLEAISLLSYGRSFVTANATSLIRFGARFLTVFAKIHLDGFSHRIAVQLNDAQDRRIRVDGKNAAGQVTVSKLIPVLTFAPGGIDLVFDTPKDRRRFLDWGVFHCEGGPSILFSNYRRVLIQRNSALRSGIVNDEELLSWEVQLVSYAEQIDQLRSVFVKKLKPIFEICCNDLGLGMSLGLEYFRGWSERDLLIELNETRLRDRRIRATAVGPHRADLFITRDGAKARDVVSRGQSKVINLALLLAQVKLAKRAKKEPVLCLDDPEGELDRYRLGLLWRQLNLVGVQSLVTGISPLRIGGVSAKLKKPKLFHVKRGVILPSEEIQ